MACFKRGAAGVKPTARFPLNPRLAPITCSLAFSLGAKSIDIFFYQPGDMLEFN